MVSEGPYYNWSSCGSSNFVSRLHARPKSVGLRTQWQRRRLCACERMVVRCQNCGCVGHASNADRICPSFGREAERHTDATVGDCVPHMNQLSIRVYADGVKQAAAVVQPQWYEGKALEVFVNGEAFELGAANGDGCDCLIDTFRQELPGIICSVASVSQHLEERHRGWATAHHAGRLPGARLQPCNHPSSGGAQRRAPRLASLGAPLPSGLRGSHLARERECAAA